MHRDSLDNHLELVNRPKGSLLQYVIASIIKSFIQLILLLPNSVRLYLITALTRLIVISIPRLRKTSLKNLSLAFPKSSPDELRQLLYGSADSLARLINDGLRLENLTDEWVQEHIEIPYLETYLRNKQQEPNRAYLFVGGHLSSVDLMAYSMGLLGRPAACVVRKFKNPFLDEWFTRIRSRRGNQVIDRAGAIKKIIAQLHAGTDVGILFDQNIKRKHAIFVDWFGKPAATSFAPALATLSSNSHVATICITYCGEDRYRIEITEIDVEDVRNDNSLSTDQKLHALTDRYSQAYQKIIRAHPHEWFWFHRRWKTTPEGVTEDFY
jgi:Kdo2-lipid IVA lauroyltransferase/acyltransferase